ncbi:protein saal1 isoform X2 [Betta splendens]|uniref:Protein saal1 isoform X2 n=1 Tax=Betta splendens TaxID=158456 RepID=A0A6P7MSZ9_BETSP|nr:protein saal1 isoform X2 [Betta splendens]
MDCNAGGSKEVEDERSSSPVDGQSPVMDRNPSPPPDSADQDEDEALDSIGDTVYSKHWLFSTLTRLIHIVNEKAEGDPDGQMQLSDDDEENLCKVWDMAMDKDVASFLQEFKATDILLGVIAKSSCPRLTEVCVGILGNIACFPETCLALSQNEDLGAVLLLLLGDTDPPTLLETSRLLLTSDLLEKVGELVDKLFDLDEELMKSWITAQPREEDHAGESRLDVASCLLEAAKQLRSESPNGLEVYLHAFQLLTTIDEGIQIFADPHGPGKVVWNFISGIVCEDLCQPTDLPVVLQEQKSILVQAFSVLHALYRCQKQSFTNSGASEPLIGTILRVLQYHSESKEDTKDEQLQILSEISAEFLADICNDISKNTVTDLVKKGFLTEKSCLTAAANLHAKFKSSFQHLHSVLSEVDSQLADVMGKQFPV